MGVFIFMIRLEHGDHPLKSALIPIYPNPINCHFQSGNQVDESEITGSIEGNKGQGTGSEVETTDMEVVQMNYTHEQCKYLQFLKHV